MPRERVYRAGRGCKRVRGSLTKARSRYRCRFLSTQHRSSGKTENLSPLYTVPLSFLHTRLRVLIWRSRPCVRNMHIVYGSKKRLPYSQALLTWCVQIEQIIARLEWSRAFPLFVVSAVYNRGSETKDVVYSWTPVLINRKVRTSPTRHSPKTFPSGWNLCIRHSLGGPLRYAREYRSLHHFSTTNYSAPWNGTFDKCRGGLATNSNLVVLKKPC